MTDPNSKMTIAVNLDFKAIEERVMAMGHPVKGLPVLDLHRLRAAKFFNVRMSEVTRSQRTHAKSQNFSALYGTPEARHEMLTLLKVNEASLELLYGASEITEMLEAYCAANLQELADKINKQLDDCEVK